MTNLQEIFTHAILFWKLPQGVEFLRESGEVWRKLSGDEADKVNAPGAGTIVRVMPNEIVWIDLLDARGEKRAARGEGE